jgi:tetratricopeptide (TPR) repeat protein
VHNDDEVAGAVVTVPGQPRKSEEREANASILGPGERQFAVPAIDGPTVAIVSIRRANVSGNGEYGAARQDVLDEVREKARMLAAQGLVAHDIVHRLDRGLTATERELLDGIVRQAVAAARRASSGEEIPPRLASFWGSKWSAAAPSARSLLGGASVVLAGAAVGVVVGLALADRDEGGSSSSRTKAEATHRRVSTGKAQNSSKGTRRSASSRANSASAHRPVIPARGRAHETTSKSSAGTASAALLNDRGYELMKAGRYEKAIPLLRRAVSASPSGADDLTHAYALFNLGHSLRLAGRPREAVPLLERRLKIDNQQATVARELEAARRSASSTGGAGLVP